MSEADWVGEERKGSGRLTGWERKGRVRIPTGNKIKFGRLETFNETRTLISGGELIGIKLPLL